MVPSIIELSHESAYLTAAPIEVRVTDADVVAVASVNPQANEQFVSRVQEELDRLLDECATQEVLQPSGCPFGERISNRVVSTPKWSIGRSVAISELAMTGLAAQAEKMLTGRAVACPSCGASLEVKLSATQAIVCHQCHAVVDVSGGVGGDLRHYAQANGTEPLIPLGRTGTLTLGKTALPWQVVGYVGTTGLSTGCHLHLQIYRNGVRVNPMRYL